MRFIFSIVISFVKPHDISIWLAFSDHGDKLAVLWAIIMLFKYFSILPIMINSAFKIAHNLFILNLVKLSDDSTAYIS